ncbi:MAG: ABC transporter ATP-binding protein [Planctomycetes bacterium]|nr:ABC transporter ATP-binding protein [Planctomycetota bacterium]
MSAAEPHPNPDSETILRTEGLSKSFGSQQAVAGLDLEVRRGDVYGFLGLNGAGKTTSLRMVLGLLRPDGGRVELFGRSDPGGLLDARRRIGAMVEGPSFYGHLSGARNLKLLGSLSGRLGDERVREVLELVGLAEAGRKAARNYSLGMKQRLGIALALISNPELVVLDEPTNGLDPSGILEMRRLIQRLNRAGTTFIISSHLLYEIEMVCNRIAILERGEKIYEGATADFGRREAARHELRAEPIERAAEIVRARGGRSLTTVEGRLSFEGLEEAIPELVAELVGAGVRVSALVERRPSLEEFFLMSSAGKKEGRLS